MKRLLSIEKLNTAQGYNSLTSDENCVHVSMEKHVFPVCRESEINVNIQDDNWKGDCKINRKRVDMQWGEWGGREISKDNGHTYQEVKRRPVEVPDIHGGIAYATNEQVNLVKVSQLKVSAI